MANGHTFGMEFGERLALAREAAGMTQKTLAEALGVDTSTVGKWETGERQPRGLQKKAEKIVKVLPPGHVTLRWLLTGEGDGPALPATQGVATKASGRAPDAGPDLAAQFKGSDVAIINVAALAKAISAVDTGLRELGLKFNADFRAWCAVRVYVEMSRYKEGSSPDVHRILEKILLDQ